MKSKSIAEQSAPQSTSPAPDPEAITPDAVIPKEDAKPKHKPSGKLVLSSSTDVQIAQIGTARLLVRRDGDKQTARFLNFEIAGEYVTPESYDAIWSAAQRASADGDHAAAAGILAVVKRCEMKPKAVRNTLQAYKAGTFAAMQSALPEIARLEGPAEQSDEPKPLVFGSVAPVKLLT